MNDHELIQAYIKGVYQNLGTAIEAVSIKLDLLLALLPPDQKEIYDQRLLEAGKEFLDFYDGIDKDVLPILSSLLSPSVSRENPNS